MRNWFLQLDQLLRGDATQPSTLKEGKFEIPSKGILLLAIVLAEFYGLCMGLYAVLRTGGTSDGWMQMLASAIKLPLLFLLTMCVTLPSLYVFNALVGSRLSLSSVINLLVASMAITVAILASLGPIVAFFSLSTTSHPFMVLLNVIVSATAGFLGLKFMMRTLNRLVFSREQAELPESAPPPALPISQFDFESERTLSPLDHGGLKKHNEAAKVFRIWVVVFALVGAQMSWVLRPFIGSPTLEFSWFRGREDNFFIAVFEVIRTVLTGG